MKIALITSLNGGVGAFISQLTENLCSFKDLERIDIYSYSDDKLKIPIHINHDKIRFIIKCNRWSFLFKLILQIPSFNKYDIIHMTGTPLSFPIIYYTVGKFKNNIVSTSHGHPGFKNWRKYYKLSILNLLIYINIYFVRLVALKSNILVVLTKTISEQFSKAYNIKPLVIYHGVDIEIFKFDEESRKKVREELDLRQSDFIALFIGKLWPHKDIFTLVDAVKEVVEKYDMKLIVIGDGPDYNDLLKRSKQLKIEEHIIVKKFVNDTVPYYSAADVFVMPSIKEEFGLVYLEAMSCELPVIAVNGHVVPEILGDAGLLYQQGNSKDLANKIMELINNKELCENLRRKGMERVKKFTWERAAKQYYKIYKKILEGNR